MLSAGSGASPVSGTRALHQRLHPEVGTVHSTPCQFGLPANPVALPNKRSVLLLRGRPRAWPLTEDLIARVLDSLDVELMKERLPPFLRLVRHSSCRPPTLRENILSRSRCWQFHFGLFRGGKGGSLRMRRELGAEQSVQEEPRTRGKGTNPMQAQGYVDRLRKGKGRLNPRTARIPASWHGQGLGLRLKSCSVSKEGFLGPDSGPPSWRNPWHVLYQSH